MSFFSTVSHENRSVYWSLNFHLTNFPCKRVLNHFRFPHSRPPSCEHAHTSFSVINILKSVFPIVLCDLFGVGLLNNCQPERDPEKRKRTAQFMFIFGALTKNIAAKLSAACRWLFYLARCCNREISLQTNNERWENKSALHDLNHYFMCSSIYPRASDCRELDMQWKKRNKKLNCLSYQQSHGFVNLFTLFC